MIPGAEAGRAAGALAGLRAAGALADLRAAGALADLRAAGALADFSLPSLRGAALAVILALVAGCEPRSVAEPAQEAAPPPAAAEPAPVEGVEPMTEPVKVVMPDPEEEPAFVHDRRSDVSLLLYHDVSTSDSRNPMKINIAKFRRQMETLKESAVPVISMSDFMKWKRGEVNIPEFCVLITFDDGWREVYTMAFPVLKEMGYPFTLFLYTKYLNIGGRSLTHAQIEEMIRAGAEIGSHSVSHLDLTSRHGLSKEGYEEFLQRELSESRTVLKERFGKDFVEVFSYPFGTYSEQIVEMAFKAGYEMMLTVDGRKNAFDTPNGEVGRYIVHGNDDTNFGYALTYRGNADLASGRRNLLAPEKEGEPSPVTTQPAAEATIGERLPLVSVDLSKLEGVDPASLSMTISGLGRVAAHYDADTRTLRYQVQQRLRSEECSVSVRLKRAGEDAEDVIAWTFFLDRTAFYLAPGDSGENPTAAGEPAERALERAAVGL